MKKQNITGSYCIGTYPKWFARIIRWGINRNPSSTVEITFRGRGTPKVKRIGVNKTPWYRYYTHGLPVRLAPKVAIYLAIKKKLRYQERSSYVAPRFEETPTV